MARYRESGERRVGRNAPLSLNIPTPTPSTSSVPVQTNSPVMTLNIMQRLGNSNISLQSSAEQLLAGGTLFDTFSTAQKNVLVGLMAKLGKNVSSVRDLKDALEAYYSDIFNNATSFADLSSQLRAEYLPGVDGTGTGVTQSITEYSDDVLNKLIENIYTSTIGKKPSPFELEAKRSELKKMIEAGTVTKTEKVGGKTVTRTTPGFSQERATTQITAEIKKENAPEYRQQQSFNFMDWLSKNAAGA